MQSATNIKTIGTPAEAKKSWSKTLRSDLRRNWSLYLLALPVLAFYIIFCYKPMYGAIIAF